ncbi:transglutaminase domain-containing protein [Tenacibaculum amylolyticum]|uniref:transglutaminase domain-containing protein n=1 Tax=Tenacibaculum amylolyticum TaxID=104269 RepID=UPI00389441D1
MKKLLLALVGIICLLSCNTNTKTYKGFPVVKANDTLADIEFGNRLFKGVWKIDPKAPIDTIKVPCIQTKDPFFFRTDIDSISFLVEGGKSYDFYVKLKDSGYAHTIIQGEFTHLDTIAFTPKRSYPNMAIKYSNKETSSYLKTLAEKYPIVSTVEGKKSDIEKILSVLNWTNSRWKHNGNVSPSKSDAITILNEAKEGKGFPCFAYGIVLKSQLENAGFKARTIYLKSKDVEDRKSSPGHVATEVYSDELQKWIFLDGQFNVMPVLNTIPLNAVELQDAINKDYDGLVMSSLGEVSKREYVEFVYDYLYHFDVSLDQRHLDDTNEKNYTVLDKGNLMLVPKGSKNPTKIDFWKATLDDYLYTNSLEDFYAKPV